MEVLDPGPDKVKKICEALKKQTLEPAKMEAKQVLDQAMKEAEKIVKRAKEEAKDLLEDQKKKLQEEKRAFYSSLNLASKQTLEMLKQEIEEALFNRHMGELFQKATAKENVVAEFINVIINALRADGINSDLEARIPESLSKKMVVERLGHEVLSTLKESDIHLSSIAGGAVVKLKKQNIALEMTDESLLALFVRFIRDEFRSFLFQNKT